LCSWFFTWFIVLHPVAGMRREMASAVELQEKQQADVYAQQLNEVGKQLAAVAEQQKRMDALLSRYEQQALRYDAVLQKWEAQTTIRK
jgi:hypothetical protein